MNTRCKALIPAAVISLIAVCATTQAQTSVTVHGYCYAQPKHDRGPYSNIKYYLTPIVTTELPVEPRHEYTFGDGSAVSIDTYHNYPKKFPELFQIHDLFIEQAESHFGGPVKLGGIGCSFFKDRETARSVLNNSWVNGPHSTVEVDWPMDWLASAGATKLRAKPQVKADHPAKAGAIILRTDPNAETAAQRTAREEKERLAAQQAEQKAQAKAQADAKRRTDELAQAAAFKRKWEIDKARKPLPTCGAKAGMRACSASSQ